MGKITFRLRTTSCLIGSAQQPSTNDIYLYTGLAVTPFIPIVLANRKSFLILALAFSVYANKKIILSSQHGLARTKSHPKLSTLRFLSTGHREAARVRAEPQVSTKLTERGRASSKFLGTAVSKQQMIKKHIFLFHRF